MGLFNTNFRTQITNFLPPVKRGGSVIDYLFSLAYPLQTGLNDNAAFETDIITRLKYNGQKIILQASLNEIFGITIAPFIIVETRQSFLGIAALVLDENEVGETALIKGSGETGTMLIIDESEETPDEKGFKILVPIALDVDDFLQQVEAETYSYKFAGTTFEVETYV